MANNNFKIKYNGFDSSNYQEITINRIDGATAADIRTSSNPFTQKSGGSVYNQLYDLRAISIRGTIHASSPDKFFDNQAVLIDAFQLSQESKDLEITLWDSKASSAVIKGFVAEMPDIQYRGGVATQGDFQVNVLCPDPLFQDATQTSVDLFLDSIDGFDVETNSGGDGFNVSSGSKTLDVTTTGSKSTETINNNGDGRISPEFLISGSSTILTNPRITNQTTGTSFKISGDLGNNDIVRVKKVNNVLTVTLNYTTNYFTNFVGDYVELQEGSNVLEFTADQFDATGKVTVNYSQRYLYINT